MGFDQNNPAPVIQPRKRTTKVNILMGVAIIVFFILGGIYIAWDHHRHPHQAAPAADQVVDQPRQ